MTLSLAACGGSYDLLQKFEEAGGMSEVSDRMVLS